LYHLETATTEKARDADGGDADRSPRKKVAGIVEGGEERDAEAAVGHGVQQAVTGSRKKEIGPQGESTQARNPLPKCKEKDESRQECSKDQGMGETAMAPKVAVVDAEVEADDVQVGNDRTERTRYPYAFGNAGSVEAGADAKGSYSV
jgi:hypothetical protein